MYCIFIAGGEKYNTIKDFFKNKNDETFCESNPHPQMLSTFLISSNFLGK